MTGFSFTCRGGQDTILVWSFPPFHALERNDETHGLLGGGPGSMDVPNVCVYVNRETPCARFWMVLVYVPSFKESNWEVLLFELHTHLRFIWSFGCVLVVLGVVNVGHLGRAMDRTGHTCRCGAELLLAGANLLCSIDGSSSCIAGFDPTHAISHVERKQDLVSLCTPAVLTYGTYSSLLYLRY